MIASWSGFRPYIQLCGYLIGLFGWVVSVPLYGAVGLSWARAQAVSFAPLPLWWLASHAPALLAWGMLWDRRPGAVRAGALWAAAACAGLTLLLLWVPAAFWLPLFLLQGIAAAAGVAAWGRWYATRVDPGWLGRVLGVTAAGICLTEWLLESVNHAVPPGGMLLLSLLPLGAAVLIASGQPASPTSVRVGAPVPGTVVTERIRGATRLGLFILFFFLVAGFSFRGLVAAHRPPFVYESLRRLPFVAGVLLSGRLADRHNLTSVITAGAGMLGLAFLAGAWGSPAMQYAGVALHGAAFGLLEPAPWLLLAAMATPANAGRWFGWGLNLNVLSIGFGALAVHPFGELSPERQGLLAVVAILLAVLSLYGAKDPLAALDRGNRETDGLEAAAAAALSRESIGALLEQRYGSLLSERELEIGQHAVAGLSTREIAQQLFISENTVKTHLRNLFRKTEAANRNELYRKLVEAEQD